MTKQNDGGLYRQALKDILKTIAYGRRHRATAYEDLGVVENVAKRALAARAKGGRSDE